MSELVILTATPIFCSIFLKKKNNFFSAIHNCCDLFSHLLMYLGSLYCKPNGLRSIWSGFIGFASLEKKAFFSAFEHIVCRESKPHNSFCHRGNTKRTAHILSNSGSSRQIRNSIKSINHASKYCIYEKYHNFGAHFILPRYDGLPWKRCSKCCSWMVYHENMLKMT